MNSEKNINKATQIEMNKKKQIILEWETALYTEYERGFWWYVIASAIAIATIVLSLIFGSKTFALVIFLISISYLILSKKEVPHVQAKITSLGVQFGDQFHKYTDIDYFWIEKHLPSFQSLHLSKSKSKIADIEIQFYDFTDKEIINTLQRFIPYHPDKHPSLIDHLVHILKL